MDNQILIDKAKFIKPTEVKAAFIRAVNNNKAHTARLITEQLREISPRSKNAIELDNLVMMKYFE